MATQVQLVKSDGTELSPLISTTTIGDGTTELNLNGSSVDINADTTGATTIGNTSAALILKGSVIKVRGGELSFDNSTIYGADLQWQTDYPILHLGGSNGDLYASGNQLTMSTATETLLSITQADSSSSSASEIQAIAGSVMVSDSNGNGFSLSSDGVNISGTSVKINGEEYKAGTTYEEATTSTAGLMSAADKTKLDGLGSSEETIVSYDVDTSATTINDEYTLSD